MSDQQARFRVTTINGDILEETRRYPEAARAALDRVRVMDETLLIGVFRGDGWVIETTVKP